jgi:hypothetical protein
MVNLKKLRWLSDDGQKSYCAEQGKDIEGETSDEHPFGDGAVSSIEEADHMVLVHVPQRPSPIVVVAGCITQRVPIDK